jgi:hypothetical protein
MPCLNYQDQLSDYIDGLLSAPERKNVEKHLAECHQCRGVYEDLAFICETSHSLPDYEPSPLVWKRISAAIASEPGDEAVTGRFSAGSIFTRRVRWFLLRPQFAIAATVLIAALVGSVIIFRSSPVESPQVVNPAPADWQVSQNRLGVQPTGVILIHKPTIDFDTVQQRISELQTQIESKQKSWDSEVQSAFQRNLEIIEQCIRHCRETLTRNQEDASVRELYLAALQAKLELLKQFAEM